MNSGKRRLRAGWWCLRLVTLILLAAAASVQAAPLDPAGDLDASFGGNGTAGANFGYGETLSQPQGVTLQKLGANAGKAVIVGYGKVDQYSVDLGLIRVNANGTVDTTWGDNGQRLFSASGEWTQSFGAIATQSDDKIVVGAYTNTTPEKMVVARFTADGDLDTSFGSGAGYVQFSYDTQINRFWGAAIQDDGKIVLAGYTRPDCPSCTADAQMIAVRLNSDGSFDTTFGNTNPKAGYTKINTSTPPVSSSGAEEARDVAIMGSGANRKILLGGFYNTNPAMVLVRLNNDGTLDSGFDSDGISIYQVPGHTNRIQDLFIDHNGKILVTGRDNNTRVITARFNANGSIDTSFASPNGYIIVSISSADLAAAVQETSDYKVITFAQTATQSSPPDYRLLFIRTDANGNLDTSYGAGATAPADVPTPGVVRVRVDTSTSIINGAQDMVLDPYDRPIGVSNRAPNDGSDPGSMNIVRLTTGGVLDTGFARVGFFNTKLRVGTEEKTYGLTLDGDKPVVVGSSDLNSGSGNFALARFNSDGYLDTNFDSDGMAKYDFGGRDDTGRAVVRQSSGKYVVVGYSSGSPGPIVLVRFNNNGSFDSSFGSSGVATSTPGSYYSQAYAAAVDRSDRVVVAGMSANNSSESDFAVARFNASGGLDWAIKRDFLGGLDAANAVIIQPGATTASDKYIVGGYITNSQQRYFGVARFNNDGSLDTSFNSPNGYITTRVSDPVRSFAGDEIRALALLSDGKFIAGGKALDGTGTGANAFALARYNANGTLDTTYGTNGIVRAKVNSSDQYEFDEINAIAAQYDDKIVAFGENLIFNTGQRVWMLARFNWTNGSLDTTYGNNGWMPTGRRSAVAGLISGDGKAVAAGVVPADLVVARYLGDPAPHTPSTPDLDTASDSGKFNNDNITNDNTPTFSGTCTTGETVVLKVSGNETSPRSRALCSNSSYSVTAASAIADGTYSFSVFAIDSAGASADSASLANVTIDTVALPPTVSSPAANGKVLPNPTISGGNAETGATVSVARSGPTAVCSTTAASSSWSCSSSLAPGPYTISVAQQDIAGNTSNATQVTFNVKAATSTTLTSSANPSVWGQSVDFTATVDAGSYGTPTGTVQFVIDGDTANPIGKALAAGKATLTKADLSVSGTAHSVVANYVEDTLYFGSNSATLSQTVNKANTTTTLSSSAANNTSALNDPVTFTAQVAATVPGAGSPSGNVTFLDGATTLNSVALVDGQASLQVSNLTVGPHQISASYGGDANFNNGSSTALTHTVTVVEPVSNWINVYQASTTSNSITRTAQGMSWASGGSSAHGIASGLGYVEAQVGSSADRAVFGLGYSDDTYQPSDIDFAVWFEASSSSVVITENGAKKCCAAAVPYSTSDTFRIAVEQGAGGPVVNWYQISSGGNSTLLYSDTNPTLRYPLALDTALWNYNGAIKNATVAGSLQDITPRAPSPTQADCSNVTWQNAVPATSALQVISGPTNAASLKRMSGSGWNAGASSVDTLAAAQLPGSGQAKVGPVAGYLAFGLSKGDTNQAMTDIDYAFYVYPPTHLLNIYYQGSMVSSVGDVAPGDVLRVEFANSSTVKFYRNDVPLLVGNLVGAASNNMPALLDTSLNSLNSSLTDAQICYGNRAGTTAQAESGALHVTLGQKERALRAVSFADVSSGDYFYQAVQYLGSRGVIAGYGDGTFRPYASVTRGQLAKIVVLALGGELAAPARPTFADVPAGSPFYQYIETAVQRRMVSGYGDGTFRPNVGVTRGQLAKMTVLGMMLPLAEADGPHFSDTGKPNPFYSYIETAYASGLIGGYADGTFRPQAGASRGQVAKIVYLATQANR